MPYGAKAGGELGDEHRLLVIAVDAGHGAAGDEAEALELLDAGQIRGRWRWRARRVRLAPTAPRREDPPSGVRGHA